MAGHDDTDGVATDGRSHGPHGPGFAQLFTDKAIAAGAAKFNPQKRLTDCVLKANPGIKPERQFEASALAGEILV